MLSGLKVTLSWHDWSFHEAEAKSEDEEEEKEEDEVEGKRREIPSHKILSSAMTSPHCKARHTETASRSIMLGRTSRSPANSMRKSAE